MPCPICTSPLRSEIERLYYEGMKPEEIANYVEAVHGVTFSVKSIENHLKKHTSPRNFRDEVLKTDRYIAQMEKELLEIDLDREIKKIVLEAAELREIAIKRIKEAAKPREVEVWSKVWAYAAAEVGKAYRALMGKKASLPKGEVWDVLRELLGDKQP